MGDGRRREVGTSGWPNQVRELVGALIGGGLAVLGQWLAGRRYERADAARRAHEEAMKRAEWTREDRAHRRAVYERLMVRTALLMTEMKRLTDEGKAQQPPAEDRAQISAEIRLLLEDLTFIRLNGSAEILEAAEALWQTAMEVAELGSAGVLTTPKWLELEALYGERHEALIAAVRSRRRNPSAPTPSQ